MWNARTKNDLVIEVWEKLDFEGIGAVEIEAIEEAVRGQYGKQAVDSPMQIARLLADEGADLRHSEIMELYIARASNRPYEAAFRNVLNVSGLKSALTSLRNLESLRAKYKNEGDKEGVRLVREAAITAKQQAAETAERTRLDSITRQINAEIAEWFRVWLQTPELFESWVDLRQRFDVTIRNSSKYLDEYAKKMKELLCIKERLNPHDKRECDKFNASGQQSLAGDACIAQ